jgi:hypothetical protein
LAGSTTPCMQCSSRGTNISRERQPTPLSPALAVCRFLNSTGTQLWPDYGESFGSFPSESKQKMFYALLLRHLSKKHGYIPGVNFFVIPFDWRTGVQGLEQVSSRARGGVWLRPKTT